ncbi:hypothetical protein BSKO_07265 [Bryopsis sp. KO-2023]|nr:hypothetical protein BSKO_05450 [Bryopsis sp. KO-2023]GMH37581.1 hypothetical protein BSKO_05454 [Bryopsis sp. KO-2023]GMH38483.1 hypothetical protein BSKO_06367 [Bryopsis sp. KO-2023]GMH39367.1 hypothetical protein BSKO_07265 [Bryopsis sp. KO-2023]
MADTHESPFIVPHPGTVGCTWGKQLLLLLVENFPAVVEGGEKTCQLLFMQWAVMSKICKTLSWNTDCAHQVCGFFKEAHRQCLLSHSCCTHAEKVLWFLREELAGYKVKWSRSPSKHDLTA